MQSHNHVLLVLLSHGRRIALLMEMRNDSLHVCCERAQRWIDIRMCLSLPILRCAKFDSKKRKKKRKKKPMARSKKKSRPHSHTGTAASNGGGSLDAPLALLAHQLAELGLELDAGDPLLELAAAESRSFAFSNNAAQRHTSLPLQQDQEQPQQQQQRRRRRASASASAPSTASKSTPVAIPAASGMSQHHGPYQAEAGSMSLSPHRPPSIAENLTPPPSSGRRRRKQQSMAMPASPPSPLAPSMLSPPSLGPRPAAMQLARAHFSPIRDRTRPGDGRAAPTTTLLGMTDEESVDDDDDDDDDDPNLALATAAQRRRRDQKRSRKQQQRARQAAEAAEAAAAVAAVGTLVAEPEMPLWRGRRDSQEEENDEEPSDTESLILARAEAEAEYTHAQLQVMCPWYLPVLDVARAMTTDEEDADQDEDAVARAATYLRVFFASRSSRSAFADFDGLVQTAEDADVWPSVVMVADAAHLGGWEYEAGAVLFRTCH
ncbi:hypothetical protein BC828DRAFT_387355 [Blastocladiella britannica]|nr:hypothetical protein BC828DRAFT_387355 [Blastocladiella britannica]